MCLAVPGKLVQVNKIDESATGLVGIVDFNGSKVEVSLAMVPEAGVGDYLLVHAGYALQVLDEQEAHETWEYLAEAGLEVFPSSDIEGDLTSLENE
jgi:hydrogenase expression/formation protein HypC